MTAEPAKARDRQRPPIRIDESTARRFKAAVDAGATVRGLAAETGFERKAIARALARIVAPERAEDGRRRGAAVTRDAQRAARAIRPPGVDGEPGTPRWFTLNALSARAGLGGAGGAHRATSESAMSDSRAPTGVRKMLAESGKILNSLGIEIVDARLRDAALFALGEEAASDRIRRILTAPVAKSRPFSALRLALDSTMPPGDVLAMLAELPAERRGEDGDADADEGSE